MSLIKNIQLVGHVCHDFVSGQYLLGGTVSYAALMAIHLTDEVRLLTSYGEDFLFESAFHQRGVKIRNVIARHTTVFENIYKKNHRIQYLHHKARNLLIDQFIESAALYMFCPIADEVRFKKSSINQLRGIKGATVQGWLRSVNDQKKIVGKRPDLSLFNHLDIVIMSEDDIKEDPGLERLIVERVPLVITTLGEHGANIFYDDKKWHSPSYQTDVVELTGAGDIFSAAFMIAYTQSNDIWHAASFAHSAASLSIEGIGTDAIPQLDQILERQILYRNKYL